MTNTWTPIWSAVAARQRSLSPPPMRRSHERIEVPPPPRMPSLGPSSNKPLMGIGAIVVALANAPAFIAWVTPKEPYATKADIEALSLKINSQEVDKRTLQLTIDELRKENDGRLRQLERVTDRLEAMRGITVNSRQNP